MNLIVSRSPRDLDNGNISWVVCADSRGLDLQDCGCGEPISKRLVGIDPPRILGSPAVILVMFFHEGPNQCRCAFDYKDFHPLKYQEYCSLLGIDSEYEADDEAG